MSETEIGEADKVQQVLDVLLQLAAAKLDARVPTPETAEPIDLVATAVNLLAEELEASIASERELRAKLEDEVAKRNAELEALARAHEQIARQNEAIRELSTPVIEIMKGVLILPLIGVIDSERGQQITEQLLTSIAQTGAKAAILDVTGVPALDGEVAGHIHRAVRASRLLGTSVNLTGVSPTGARVMVELGVDFSETITERSLEAGLRRAIALSRGS